MDLLKVKIVRLSGNLDYPDTLDGANQVASVAVCLSTKS